MQADVSDWLQKLSDLSVQCEQLTKLEPVHRAQALWIHHSDLKHKVTDFKLKVAQVSKIGNYYLLRSTSIL